MDKEYFREYYILERNHWWFKVREKIIREKIAVYKPAQSDLKILNIGAATGRSSEMLSEFGEVTSIEFDEDCYRFTKENVGISIIQGSILDLPFANESFDIVCAFDVIEHVEDDGMAVEEMKRVCKKDGIIAVTVPAFMSLWSHHDVVNHHYRRYKMPQIVSLFKNTTGFILYKSYFNSLLFFPIFLFRSISKILPTNWTREGAGSDFSVRQGVASKALLSIFSLESRFLKKIKFPFGVSILFLWKK